MNHYNHYDTLNLSSTATSAEIKQSYRRLVKLFHPDSKSETANHEQIVRLNAAYEVLGDPQQRRAYDRQLHQHHQGNRQQRAESAQKHYRTHKHSALDADAQIQQWLNQVYVPVNQLLRRILNPLKKQLEQLSADPFDDKLMEVFQAYLENCRHYLNQAQVIFRSLPNPPTFGGVAAHIYYCLNQLGDGIEELNMFTLNYDEYYLHTGKELFRIATSLRQEAQEAIKAVA